MSLQVRRIMAEPCEAAQPEMKSSHSTVVETESLHEGFDSFKFVEDNKPFYKLQSPAISEFDSDTNSEDGSCSGVGSDVNHAPEEEDVDTPELLRLQNIAPCYEAAKSEQQVALQLQGDMLAIARSEVGQPNTSQGEIVIGCDLSLSRFYLERRHGLIQPESRFQRCMPTEVLCDDVWRLLAQQIVIVKGWKEHISSPNKQSLKNLAYTQDLINGHPIGKCILTVFHRNSIYYRGDFVGERKGPPLVNSSQNTTPHRKLFSQQTDASISLWEKAFSEQFGKNRIVFKGCNITAPLLLVLLYRSAYQGSIMIRHFIRSECRDCMCCSLGIQKAMLKLDKIHCLMCKYAQQMSSKMYDEESAAKDHEQMNLLYHHCESSAHNYPYIEFPHIVEVGIQQREKKLTKTLHIIYMQIPPYFFAVPADCCDDTTHCILEPHFPSVIREIHKRLEIERECFFKQRPGLRVKENLVMIYPYRFGPGDQHSECRFLRVTINIDGG